LGLAVLAALVLTGLAAGFLAGLVGIGGGVLMVPFLYFFYAHPAWSGAVAAPALHVTLAHATSLFIIVPTALLGTWSYARKGLVTWRTALPVAGFSIPGAWLGVQLALVLPGDAIRLSFGVFLVISALQLLRGRNRAELPPREAVALPLLAAIGIAVGAFSAIMGVGGGLVAIPMLLHFARTPLKNVAALSLAIICFAAPAGTASYMIGGQGVAGLPAGSIGFVHIAAALPILAGALVSVQLGAAVNRRMDTRRLRMVFAAVLMVLGAQIVVTSVQRLT
jgi:uncharacterized protein